MLRDSDILLYIVKYCMKEANINIFKYSEILNSSIYDTDSSWSYIVRFNLQLLYIDENYYINIVLMS